MKINLSPNMKKCIDDVKAYAEINYKNIEPNKVRNVTTKVSKKKIFHFKIMNIGKPIIKILINKRYYKTLIKIDKEWKEI